MIKTTALALKGTFLPSYQLARKICQFHAHQLVLVVQCQQPNSGARMFLTLLVIFMPKIVHFQMNNVEF